MSSQRNKGSSPDGAELTLWVFLGAIALFGIREWWNDWSETEGDPRERFSQVWPQVVPWLIPTGIIVAFALAIWWWMRRIRRLRTYQAHQYAAAVAPLMPSKFGRDHLEVTRWWGLHPRTIKIDLLPECNDEDPTWRTELVEHLTKKSGESFRVRWPSTRNLLRARRRVVLRANAGLLGGRKASPAAALAPEDQSAASDALHGALTTLMPRPKAYVSETADDGSPAALRITYAETTRDMSPNWRERVRTQVENRLDGRWVARRWDTKNRTVHLELVPSLPEDVPWTPSPRRQAGNRMVCRYGVDADGYDVAWVFSSRQPHGLVVGETGAGKSETMTSIACSALWQGALAVIVAPKPEDFVGFLEMPGVACVASEIEDRAEAILAVHAQMKRRLAARGIDQLERMRPTLTSERPASAELDGVDLLIVIDEKTQLTDDFDKWWASMSKEERKARWGTESRRCPFSQMLSEVAQLSRAAGFHLLEGMQRPDAKNFNNSTNPRDNFGHLVSMGELSRIGSSQLWGDPLTGRIAVDHAGEGVTNATRLDADGQPVETGRPRRFKALRVSEDTLLSEGFRDELAQIAPDVSRLDLGNVSAAARTIDGAYRELRRQAGFSSPTTTGESSDTAAADGTRAGATVADVVDAASDAAAVSEPVEGAAAQPEVDADGQRWDLQPVTELAAGDVICSEDGERAKVLDASWYEDEFDAGSVFRLTVDTDDGEVEWDMDPDDSIQRMLADEAAVVG